MNAAREERTDFLWWAVAIIGFVSVWRFNLLFLKQVSFLRLGVVSLAIGLIAWYFAGGRLRSVGFVSALTPVRLVAALLMVGVAGIPLGVYPGRTFDFVRIDYLSGVIYFLLTVACVRSRLDVERLLLMHIVGAGIYSLNAFRMRLEGGRLSHLAVYDANDFGFLLVCTIPIAVYFLRTGASIVTRVLAGSAILLFVIQLVRTGSRGAFLGMIGVGLFLLFRFKGIPVRVRIGATVAAIFTLVVAASDRYWEMMSTIRDPSSDYNMTEEGGRLKIWQRGLGYMIDYPIAGVGFGSFAAAEGRSELNKARVEEGRGWVQKASHNSFIQMGAEGGFVGLFIFLWILAMSFKACNYPSTLPASQQDQDEVALGRALSGALLGYCVAGTFVSQAYSTYLYSLLGLIGGLVKLRQFAPVSQPAVHRITPVLFPRLTQAAAIEPRVLLPGTVAPRSRLRTPGSRAPGFRGPSR